MYLDNYAKIIKSDNPEAYFIENNDYKNWYLFDFEIKGSEISIFWCKNILFAIPFISKQEVDIFIKNMKIKNRNIRIKYVKNIKEL